MFDRKVTAGGGAPEPDAGAKLLKKGGNSLSASTSG